MKATVFGAFLCAKSSQSPSTPFLLEQHGPKRFHQHDHLMPSRTSSCRHDSAGTRLFNSRRTLIKTAFSSAVAICLNPPQKALAIPEQKSYSSNARNMERLSNGDSSGGSVYNNFPSSNSAAKRRAMVGCKTESSRKMAMEMEGLDVLGEKDCNLKVMDGNPEFMLKALRELDCPSCPYGIKGA